MRSANAGDKRETTNAKILQHTSCPASAGQLFLFSYCRFLRIAYHEICRKEFLIKTLESIFSRTAQFGLLIYLTGCFGLLIVLGAAVAKWLKLIDVIQYIAFAFGLGLLTLLIGMVGLSLLGIRGIEEF